VRKKLDYLHLKDFLKYECELYLKQPLTQPYHKAIATNYTSNHRFAMDSEQWLTIPISTVIDYATFAILL
jgi:hypothetical protein